MIRAFQAAGLGSELEKKVFKATYDDQDQPKIKHVKALVEACGGSGVNTSVDIILDCLYKRLSTAQKWNEILKTLVVIHTLTSVHGVSSERMLKIIQDRKALNSSDVCGTFLDDRSSEGKGQSRFIAAYVNYLVEKIITFKTINYSYERAYPKDDSKWVASISLDVVFKALPRLQKQLEIAMLCEPYQWNGKVHPIGWRATELVLKDAFRLYSGINLMMVAILERHGSLTLSQAETALECGKKDGTLHEKFMLWSQALQDLGFLKDKDKEKEKKDEDETLDEGEIPSSPMFAQSVSESFVSVLEFLVQSLKKKATGQLKGSMTPGPKSSSRTRSASSLPTSGGSSSTEKRSSLAPVSESATIGSRPPPSPSNRSKQTSKTPSSKSRTSSPKEETEGKTEGSPVVVTEEWDPFADFNSTPAPKQPINRSQRSASAAPAPTKSAPPSAMKRQPSSTRTKPGQSSIPETVSEDFDPWADFSTSTSTDTSTSTPFSPFDTSPTQPQQSQPQPQPQPQQPILKTKRSGSVDHYSSLLSVNTTFTNPSTPLKVTPTPPAGTGLGINSTSRLRAGSAAPALSIQPGLPHTDTAGLAQSEVLAIQAQLEALQAAQLALSQRLGQLSVTLQPVLPITPRVGAPSPDVYGGVSGGITTPVPFPPAPTYQGISTPVPFPPAPHSSSASTSTTSTEYDPFADFA